MINIDKEFFIKTCYESKTASEAARKLNIHFNTFKRYAIKYNCYFVNQGSKGIKHAYSSEKILTEDILTGKYPEYETYKLKKRLFKYNIKQDRCERCGWDLKRPGDIYSPCELHHIDGDSHNHRLENLIILCPNCHSLTENYRSKNKYLNKIRRQF